MSHGKDPLARRPQPLPEGHDDDREAILARRNRFVAAALAGLAGASLVAACGGEIATDRDRDAGSPQPGFSPTTTPSPCLEFPVDRDASPQPCLFVAPDASPNDPTARDAAASDAADTNDADTKPDSGAPFPCLKISYPHHRK